MPFYDYIEAKTGQRVELLVPMKKRDQVLGHTRVLVPATLRTTGFAEDPHTMEAQARQGLKACEETYGRQRLERETGYTVPQLKRIWAPA